MAVLMDHMHTFICLNLAFAYINRLIVGFIAIHIFLTVIILGLTLLLPHCHISLCFLNMPCTYSLLSQFRVLLCYCLIAYFPDAFRAYHAHIPYCHDFGSYSVFASLPYLLLLSRHALHISLLSRLRVLFVFISLPCLIMLSLC